MTNINIKTLNNITELMIDSYDGYKKAIEKSDENYALRSNFQARTQERATLINDFQSEVRTLGGEPETEGTVRGSTHRGFLEFVSLFQDDEKAALNAIDDGEEYLSDKIKDALQEDGLTPRTRDLLMQAHQSAKAGERFADRMEEAA